MHELQPTRVARPFEIRAINGTAGLLLKVGVQVEPADRADARGIFVEWKRATMRGIDLGPGLEAWGFTVDNQAIEIEYQCRDAFS